MKVQFISLLVAWVLISPSAVAQTAVWPDGLYYTADEFLSKKPRMSPQLELVTRDSGDISSVGGNQFKFSCMDYMVDETDIWQKVLLVKDKGQLYLNALLIDRGFGFARCESEGPFIAAYLNLADHEDRFWAVPVFGVAGGAVGGLIAGAVIAATEKRSYDIRLYTHSLRTGNSRLLTREYIEARFADHPDLLKQFMDENPGTDEPSDEVKIRYINLLNERVGLH